MLNGVFVFLVLVSVGVGALFGDMKAVTQASIDSAVSAAELALGLLGQFTLWLGLVHIVQEAGLMAALARGLEPVMRRLFPEIPQGDPALGAIMLNLSANALGITNAATPFGLKAMKELQRLNRTPWAASNSMVTFLAMTASGVAVLPTGMIAVRASMGSANPAGITVPSILATFCSTVVAVSLALLLARRWPVPAPPTGTNVGSDAESRTEAGSGLEQAEAVARIERRFEVWPTRITGLAALVVAYGFVTRLWIPLGSRAAFEALTGPWLIPLLIASLVGIGFARGVPVYEAFIRGAKEGFQVVVLILPYLVGILTAIGLFRGCGALEAVTTALGPWLQPLGFPPEALPMALVRPLSGSGALGVVIDTLETHGADSFAGTLVTVMNGSTDTTFYIIALYFGSVGVQAVRHALLVCLAADLTGMVVATALTHVFFG